MESIYPHSSSRSRLMQGGSLGGQPHTGGYSLVELLVVLAVITIVTMTVLTSQGSFNKTLILTNTAYDLALTLRFTETYGLSSRVLSTAANTGYGLHFTKGTTNSFVLFADTYPAVGTGSLCHPLLTYDPTGPSALAGDCVWQSSATVPPNGETIQTYTLNNAITIKDICAQTVGSGAWSCANSNGSALTSLDIVFARPNPNAYITGTGSQVLKQAACIKLTSAQGNFKYIYVSASGQITANGASLCPA